MGLQSHTTGTSRPYFGSSDGSGPLWGARRTGHGTHGDVLVGDTRFIHARGRNLGRCLSQQVEQLTNVSSVIIVRAGNRQAQRCLGGAGGKEALRKAGHCVVFCRLRFALCGRASGVQKRQRVATGCRRLQGASGSKVEVRVEVTTGAH